MKCLLVVCDGMADRPIISLKGKTPLELANTPNLDHFAEKGITGIVDPIGPGIRPGSDTAHLAILGYDPMSAYTGRGPFEASGVGLDVRAGDVAFRTNFATIDGSGLVIDRRAGRITNGTDDLRDEINKIAIHGVDIRFKESTGHRGALVISGEGLSHNICESDPHKVGVLAHRVEALDKTPEAINTANVLNMFIEKSHKVLKNHPINKDRIEKGLNPANMLLLRGAGVAPRLTPFKVKTGMTGGCIASVALVRGVGRFCGLDVLGTKTKKTVEELGRMALQEIENYDFILLNIKGPDDAAHDGDASKKISVIEEIDRVANEFKDYIKDNYLVMLSDHTSSISRMDHTGDPVPIMINGPEVLRDSTKEFSERGVLGGGLHRLKGIDIMNIVIDLMNRSEKFGA